MLSILIIEDTPEKLLAVKETIRESIGNDLGRYEIDVVNDIKNALNKLSDISYDLMLIDMYIPQEWGVGNPDPKNAVEFIQQLHEDEDLHVPLSILAITKKEELDSEIKRKLEQHAIFLLRYSESSDVWKPQLRNRLKSLISAKSRLYSRVEYDYDVAIINALQIPEHSQLKSVFGNGWSRVSYPLDDFNNYYEKVIINKDGKPVKCIATYAHQMASIASASLATKMIYNFRPQYLFMTGIAAGISHETMNYGDILVASEVFDGASGKIRTEEGSCETIFEPDIRQKSLDAELISLFNRLKSDRSLLNSIYDAYPITTGKPNSQLSIHVGPMASVPAVISSQKEIEKLKIQGERKLQGVEMESYGMFYAACNAIKPLPKFVASLKSVSDFADAEKNDKYQEYAAYTSAALLKYIIENELKF